MSLKEIAVIGGGVIGRTTAFHLANIGHSVTIIDPKINQAIPLNGLRTGSQASLGVIMGNIFHRASGRSWKLRQRSMELWPEWIAKLSTPNVLLELKSPLIKFASSNSELEKMKVLCKERSHLGLKIFDKNLKIAYEDTFPTHNYGGLISSFDGQINPLLLLNCLLLALDNLKVEKISGKAFALDRCSNCNQPRWKITLEENQTITKDYVIICSALNSEELINKLGHKRPMEGVLGQAIQISLESKNSQLDHWPSVLVTNGINLIPQNKNELIIGATLEHAKFPSQQELENLQSLNGNAPKWLKKAHIKNKWHGIRAKPTKQPSPLLEKLEPGLIVNTAHYRNGILLAPACAEWVGQQI